MTVSAQASRLLLLGALVALVIVVLVALTASPSSCLAIPALAIHTSAFSLRLLEPTVERFWSRSHPSLGPFVLLGCIALVILAIIAALAALAKLVLMLASLLAIPFGTLVYLAVWGHFPRGDARVVLSTILLLVLVSGALTVLSNPKVVKNVRLVIAYLFALLLVAFISAAHGFLPSVLASITDAIAAIIVAIVGAVAALRVGISQIRTIRGLFEKIL